MGGYYRGEWFASSLPGDFNVSCVTWREIISIYVSCILWSEEFSGKRLVFHCDNLGVVQCWEKLGASNNHVLELMRRILMIAATKNFTITIKHLTGADNSIAHALSRLQFERFRALAPFANRNPTNIPDIWDDILTQ